MNENRGGYDVPIVADVQFSIEVFCTYEGSSANGCLASDVLHCPEGDSGDGAGDDDDGDWRWSRRVDGAGVTADNGAKPQRGIS